MRLIGRVAKRWLLVLGGSILVGGLCLSLLGSKRASALGFVDTNGWSQPVNLSNTPDLWSYYPRIASDQMNGLHVVWSQNSLPSDQPSPDTISYTYLKDGVWAEPVDVLAAVHDGTALVRSLVARGDTLYLLWIDSGDVCLSSAQIGEAASAHGWNTGIVPANGSARYADMTWDERGNVYIFQVDLTGAIYIVRSTDRGQTYSDPKLVWTPPKNSLNVSAVRGSAANGVLHVVWTMNAEEIAWNSYGVGYARSVDDGDSWEDMWSTSDLGADGNVIVDGRGYIHVMWNRSAQGGSRAYRWSSDGGQSWSPIEYLWPGMFGKTGFPGMAIDSRGDLHVLTSNDLGVGLYHLTWRQGVWDDVEPAIAARSQWGELPWLTVAGGNQLHAVYMSFGNSDVWYIEKQIDSPAIAPQPFAEVQARAALSPAENSTAVWPAPTAQYQLPIDLMSPPLMSTAISSVQPMALAVAASLGAIAAAVVFRRWRQLGNS